MIMWKAAYGGFKFGEVSHQRWRFVLIFKVAGKIKKGEIVGIRQYD